MNEYKCVSCQQPLIGKHCHNCGEKVVEESDFSIKTISLQFVDGLTNIDSKFIKSFLLLLFKPGQLTLNYVKGNRNPYMRPFQLFIVVNILFFLLLADADIFRIPAEYYISNEINTQKVEASNLLLDDVKQKYDALSLTNSKLFIFILIPFFSLVFWLVNLKKRHYFGVHTIFAIHYLSFFMLFCVTLVITPKELWTPRAIQLVIFGANFVYLAFAIKNFYNENWKISILKTFICLVLCFMFIFLYREQISNYTLYTLLKN